MMVSDEEFRKDAMRVLKEWWNSTGKTQDDLKQLEKITTSGYSFVFDGGHRAFLNAKKRENEQEREVTILDCGSPYNERELFNNFKEEIEKVTVTGGRKSKSRKSKLRKSKSRKSKLRKSKSRKSKSRNDFWI